MKLHELKPAPGSTKARKRIGRGNAAGQGTTAGKGTKGQRARSGGSKAGFRGVSSRNQRMAKRRGFTNRFKTAVEAVNVGMLAQFEDGSTLDENRLREAGMVKKSGVKVKILGDGEVTVPLHLVGLATSASAREKIEAAGGSIKADDATSKTGKRVASKETSVGTSGA